MSRVRFTSHLQKFFPALKQDIHIDGRTVAEIVAALDQRFPGLAAYIVDERGALRKHVNIFVANEMIVDRQALTDALEPATRVFVAQALSGG